MSLESLREAYLLMGGIVFCPVSCLARGIPALMPTSYWVGPGLVTNGPRWQLPTAVFMKYNVLYGCTHYLCAHGELEPPPASPGNSLRLAVYCGSGFC